MLWSVVDKFLSFFCGDRYLVWLRPRACISIKRLGKGKIKLRPNPIWWKRPRQWINGAVGRKSMATLLILTTSVQKFDGVGKMWLNLIFTFIFLMYSTDFLWAIPIFCEQYRFFKNQIQTDPIEFWLFPEKWAAFLNLLTTRGRKEGR
jgi:hypothetical protein